MSRLLDNINNRQFKRIHRWNWLKKRRYVYDIIMFGYTKIYMGITESEAKQMAIFTKQLTKYSK